MKKLISVLLAIMMLGAIACTASADEVPSPKPERNSKVTGPSPAVLRRSSMKNKGIG